MRMQLQQILEARVQQCVNHQNGKNHCHKIVRKKESLKKRNAEIVKARAEGKITHTKEGQDGMIQVYYAAHFQYLIKQKGFFYIEEETEQRRAKFLKNKVIEDAEVEIDFDYAFAPEPSLTKLPASVLDPFTGTQEGSEPFISIKSIGNHHPGSSFQKMQEEERTSYRYDRRKAVQYAEKWWNTYNPSYRKFENDCTNFVSQCLHQGGAPMRGHPNRGSGWWMKGQNYSYTWAVANSLKQYLPGAKIGLRAKEVKSPETLLYGDIICYDFQGDGRIDHNTIVTGKDAEGMPLVNAHTYNSRMRYWAYEDSSAYTPNIKYRFFTIVDDQ